MMKTLGSAPVRNPYLEVGYFGSPERMEYTLVYPAGIGRGKFLLLKCLKVCSNIVDGRRST
jgi:hypothetical protein